MQVSCALNQPRIKNIMPRLDHKGYRRSDTLTYIPCGVSKSVLELLLKANFRILRLNYSIDLEFEEGTEILCLQDVPLFLIINCAFSGLFPYRTHLPDVLCNHFWRCIYI